ncbi:MAG: 3-dehydroquinate synthase [Desulfobacteraceae bacterium]|nr:3-dehydroquinate synthase [Desulfobacteraceae bacterium]
MQTLEIKGSARKSTLLVGESIENLPAYIPAEKTIIITDTNVKALYGHRFPKCPVVTIGTGEKIKTLETVNRIFKNLVEMEVDRSAFILAIGGGIVCDIAGFVSSTYLRGIRFGFAATSLLAQVDASVGGKNGVNFSGYKNMVGVFNQPEFVICDMHLLKTLPQKEIHCGFGEIIKHAAIADGGMMETLKTDREKALSLDHAVMEQLVHKSVVIKSTVVNRDEKEQGERRILNFGHTFGHAYEKIYQVSHGEAVAMGMVVAVKLSVKSGLLSVDDCTTLINLIESYRLPTKLPVDSVLLMDAIKRDKKRDGHRIHFILLDRLGHAVIRDYDISDIQRDLEALP